MQHQGDLMINADLIIKQLQCAVCINEFNNPFLTKCGHCFCYNCIEEVINRYHKCPLCNLDLNKTDIFKNNQINQIKCTFIFYIEIIDEQKKQQLNNKVNNVFGDQTTNSFLPDYKMISDMFKNAIQQMYNIYESKYIDAIDEFKARQQELKIDYTQKLETAKEDQVKEQITNNYKEALRQIENSFKQLKDYYAECVYKTLEQFKCEQIDILIQIVLPQQNTQFPWPFKVNNRISSIAEVILQYFDKKNDPIQNFDPSRLKIIFCKPQDLYKISQLVQKQDIDIISQQYQIYPMNSEIFLASLGQVKQGSIIVVISNINLKSSQPKECITYKFNKDKLVDYFSCQQCKIHWVCQTCKDFCHQGHQLSIYRQQVKPDWACCYCVSKGFCKALNKNNQ
ncbi:unnamed protein product [Paramecium primaurelia]|uniref:RING-type domain-containing protein n=1 Tax=Paramecium primaurelia TaxID=5886 RepID=A0A8S1KX58_PARPR|nr:unnamed protein product [Paramecium primaurelia]